MNSALPFQLEAAVEAGLSLACGRPGFVTELQAAARAVGKAAIVPVCFAVNEPLLFAAPIVLNPVFFVPFVFAPIANIWILKIFIDFLGMNGFMYTLPWTVPGPIGTIMGLGFQPSPLFILF